MEVSRKVRRIPQNVGVWSDETGRDRREVRRDMREIVARSAVSDRYLPLLVVTYRYVTVVSHFNRFLLPDPIPPLRINLTGTRCVLALRYLPT